MGQTFTIGELAAEFDLTPRAIRFYEARGLLSPLRRGTSRIYSKRDRGRLALIIRGKNLGFSLEDIDEYLSLYDATQDPGQAQQTELLLKKVEDHLARLATKRADLDRTISELSDIASRCRLHLAEIKPRA